ncbi:MAG: DUF362 domain-containing protein [Deltaproteobacteria bacterium]|nr:DUF362 domain-containing protein [Deltaproteobacteria bacterium]
MSTSVVAVVRYEKPLESVGRAIKLSGGLDHLPPKARVFVKPNIVLWTRRAVFPKWGVITTTRVLEDVIAHLKERGIDDITIGEGMVLFDPKDKITPSHAFESLGHKVLEKKYGVKCLNVFERPFKKVDIGCGVKLNFNVDILESDFVVNIPVLKTHHQTVVSLGIKNLKGTIDVSSRKQCHSADTKKDLHYMISKLANKMPPGFTLLDGIYTTERGPSVNGVIRRSNLLVGSRDVFSTDVVGAKLLGYEPHQVPHLVHAAEDRNRPLDLSDVEVVGEKIEDVASFHNFDFSYNENGLLPTVMEKRGMSGVTYRKYDSSICTYCAGLYPVIMAATMQAWKGTPWDDVEVLTGKVMEPTHGKNSTILIGKCMCQKNSNHPNIRNLIAVKGCPPDPKALSQAFHQAGIEVDPETLENWEQNMGLLMKKYEGRPEFDESLFRASSAG